MASPFDMSAAYGVDITANNGANFADGECIGIEVTGSGGTIHVVGADGLEHTWTVMAGHQYAIRAYKLFATGTTATGIVAYFPYRKKLPP